MELLNKIQQELKVPKGQYNSFAKYNYRNAEDILEAVKPLLGSGVLTLSDSIFETAGGRVYVVATATLEWYEDLSGTNADGKSYTAKRKEQRSVQGYAREASEKKGMDEAQITGAASSYARKYALNGLFCIDDTKDSDSQDNSQPGKTPAGKVMLKATTAPSFIDQVKKATLAKKSRIKELIDAKVLNPIEGTDDERKNAYEAYVLSQTGLKMTPDNLDDIITRLEQLG